MTPLERSLIEKAGYANGWENVRESSEDRVVLFSSRHKAEAVISSAPAPGSPWPVHFPKGPPPAELVRSFPTMQAPGSGFHAQGEAALGALLRRAAELAMSLPTQAADAYAQEVAAIEEQGVESTEALAMVKRRIGQNLYRQALIDYWGGACSVTGLDLPDLLRASHAKPWAKCTSDVERLDVFNGFLLAAHLDALFDAGLISFDDRGHPLYSSQLGAEHLAALGISPASPAKLRWVSPGHLIYLDWHRRHVFQP